MKSWRQWLAPSVALLLVLAAVGWLFQVRLGGGNVYPEYSSLRADALGTRAFAEALEQIPGMAVTRDYRPLSRLSAQPRLLVLAGLRWRDWQSVPAREFEALNAAAHAGARVVLAFRADRKRDEGKDDDLAADEDEPAKKKETPAKEAKETPAKEAKEAPAKEAKETPAKEGKEAPGKEATVTPAKEPKESPAKGGKEAPTKDKKDTPAKETKDEPPGPHAVKERPPKELAKEWGITFKHRWLFSSQPGAQRTDEAPADLPAQVAWQSDVHFTVPAGSGGRVLYRRAGEPVLVEKAVGRGSVVLLADAYCLSNEAMDRDRATALLAYLVGGHRQVTFVESTLGVLEDNGLGSLARRYGLGGALALCVLLGLLYAWRRLVPFLPSPTPAPGGRTETLTYEPAAGLTGLLHRSLGGTAVLAACVEEWRKARRAGGGSEAATQRLESAWQSRDPQQPVLATYNALARALKPR